MTGETTTVRTKEGLVVATPRIVAASGSTLIYGASEIFTMSYPGDFFYVMTTAETIEVEVESILYIDAWVAGYSHETQKPNVDPSGNSTFNIVNRTRFHEDKGTSSVSLGTYFNLKVSIAQVIPAGETTIEIRFEGLTHDAVPAQIGYSALVGTGEVL